MVYTRLFFPSKCSLFHNSNVFSSCIINILYTGCAKIKKNNYGAKRLTLSSHLCLGLPSGFFPSGFPHQNPVYTSPLPPIHATCPAHLIRLDLYNPDNIWGGVQIIKALHYVVFSTPPSLRPSYAQIFSSTPYSQTF